MGADYTYMVSNNKIAEIMEAMTKAARPERLSQQTLKKWGFASSNDRAIIPLFRKLGILDVNGKPTELYDDIKDPTTRAVALADAIRESYSDLFSVNTKIYEADDEEVKAALARVTGKDAKSVDRYFATLSRLFSLADFESSKLDIQVEDQDEVTTPVTEPPTKGSGDVLHSLPRQTQKVRRPNEFHYNIQIHLPATTDISVYNAIFKALKDNLDVE